MRSNYRHGTFLVLTYYLKGQLFPFRFFQKSTRPSALKIPKLPNSAAVTS